MVELGDSADHLTEDAWKPLWKWVETYSLPLTWTKILVYQYINMNVVVYATNGLLQLLYSYRMFLRTYLLMDVSHFPRTAKGQNDMQICIHGGKNTVRNTWRYPTWVLKISNWSSEWIRFSTQSQSKILGIVIWPQNEPPRTGWCWPLLKWPLLGSICSIGEIPNKSESNDPSRFVWNLPGSKLLIGHPMKCLKLLWNHFKTL
jgi:hypothetical protein